MLVLGSGFLYTIFDYSSYGAVGVGHDTVDVMVIMGILKNPIVGITLISVVFILLSFLTIRKNKNLQNLK